VVSDLLCFLNLGLRQHSLENQRDKMSFTDPSSKLMEKEHTRRNMFDVLDQLPWSEAVK
jgi:hypothetical protein